jgi:hypothetical protein
LLFAGCIERALPIPDHSARPEGSHDVDLAAQESDAGVPDFAPPSDLAGAPRDLPPASTDLAASSESPFDDATTLALPTGYTGRSVAIGDVTGDGRADVVVGVSAPSGTAVVVFAQTAARTLAAPVVYAVLDFGAGPDRVAIGDLNGDGLLDVAVTRFRDVGVLYQNRAGALDALQTLTLQPASQGADVLAVADFNHDGRADLLARAGNDVDVWFQSADGKLSAQPYRIGCGGSGDIAVADFDNDGRLDVVIGGQNDTVGCLLRQVDSGFTSDDSYSLGRNAWAIAGGDVNHDGRADLVVAGGGNRPASYIGVATQPPNSVPTTFAWMTSYDLPGAVVIADIDEDALNDVIVLHVAWNAIGWYRQIADGSLAAEQLIKFPRMNSGTERIAVGDVNGDGHPDIIGADASLTVLYHR